MRILLPQIQPYEIIEKVTRFRVVFTLPSFLRIYVPKNGIQHLQRVAVTVLKKSDSLHQLHRLTES